MLPKLVYQLKMVLRLDLTFYELTRILMLV
uniref:Uncharacterized protein n=1 Tax=Picea sitchensis TaxID=3332 RepID=A0A6B9XUP2_PICSI|nr:hypothetical protein Q903MT_gene3854 [Picea sitchensis]